MKFLGHRPVHPVSCDVATVFAATRDSFKAQERKFGTKFSNSNAAVWPRLVTQGTVEKLIC